MNREQSGILAPLPAISRHVFFDLRADAAACAALDQLADLIDGERTVVGLGHSLLRAIGREVPGMKDFRACSGAGFDIPSTPAALWCWLRGDDRGELVLRTRRLEKALHSAFVISGLTDAFQYADGRDLSGYEDGTENPTGEDALAAALVSDHGPGLDGSSFVAVQRWVLDFDALEAISDPARDLAIGRRRSDNEEIDDAPPSAHVKRTAQESFDPPAFMLRRSMPWNDECHAGLMFVAFGRSFAAFEAQLRRMAGLDDGIGDALFGFTRPVSGAYFWCPPMRDGRLDLSLLAL